MLPAHQSPPSEYAENGVLTPRLTQLSASKPNLVTLKRAAHQLSLSRVETTAKPPRLSSLLSSAPSSPSSVERESVSRERSSTERANTSSDVPRSLF